MAQLLCRDDAGEQEEHQYHGELEREPEGDDHQRDERDVAVGGQQWLEVGSTDVEQEVNGLLTYDRKPKFDVNKIKALNEIAQRRGQSLAQLALAWTLRDPRVTSALVGVSSLEQLEANVAALDRLEFADDELEAIDRHATESGINLWG